MADEATETHDRDPFAPGSLGELVPDLWFDPKAWPDYEPEAPLSADEALERYLDWCADRGMELWDHQEEALLDLAAGDHVILGTPTGSGKSMVALGLCYLAICQHKRAYYTAPIKALVSEKFFDLVDAFGKDNVGMITGDTQINTDAPVICCTEEILANQALREGAGSDVAAVAMDEFHFFGEADRGWAWQVPLLALPNTQFLLMSATLGDVSAVTSLLERQTDRTVDAVTDAERPVPLTYEYVDTPLEATVELALRNGDAPIYIVHFAQDAALNTAQSLASYGVATKEQRDAVKQACKGTRFTTAFGKTLQRLLSCGVGVHHAGMLPRYRLLVEKLAQQGLLPVICGTDTLGVGINVPIHTVLLTALTKFDGHRMRRLRAREFHQIAGRAGRAGYDTAGTVVVMAPEHDIENAQALAKAGDDPKKLRKVVRKKAPTGFVNWGEASFEKLVAAEPEPLTPHLQLSAAMLINVIARGGDAFANVRSLVFDNHEPRARQYELARRALGIFRTLVIAGVVEVVPAAVPGVAPGIRLTVDLQPNFALNQPLSPFALAAIELLDPEADASVARQVAAPAPAHAPALDVLSDDATSDPALSGDATSDATDPEAGATAPADASSPAPAASTAGTGHYALDVVSIIEATLDDPRPVLSQQQFLARGEAVGAMKRAGIEYDERMELLEAITYPKPLEELLAQSFEVFASSQPWVRDFELSPKSVVRDMFERALSFGEFISQYQLARSEGLVLRYLSDAYRAIRQTVPNEAKTDELLDIIEWLGELVRQVDSSLVDEWEELINPVDAAADGTPIVPPAPPSVLTNRRAFVVLVRNELFRRVRLAALQRDEELAELDPGVDWSDALDGYFDEHDEILTGGPARSPSLVAIDESDAAEGVWKVEQTIDDPEGNHDWRIRAEVDLAESEEEGTAVLRVTGVVRL